MLIARVPGPFWMWFVLALIAPVVPSLVPGHDTFVIEAYAIGLVIGLFFVASHTGPLPGLWVRRITRWFADISVSLYLTHVVPINFLRTAMQFGLGIDFSPLG